MKNSQDAIAEGKRIANELAASASSTAELCELYAKHHNELHESMGDTGYEYEKLSAIKQQLRYLLFATAMQENGYVREDDGLGSVWVKK